MSAWRVARALGLGAILGVALVVALVEGARWRDDRRVDYLVFGTEWPLAVGDTATVCAVEVRGDRWTLLAQVRHLQRLGGKRVLIVARYGAREACRALLWDRGVSVDTLPVVDRSWTLRGPAAAPRDEVST